MPDDIPERPFQQHTGITHSINFDNKYFKATLPIWIDEFLDHEKSEDPTVSASAAWSNDFCSDDEDVKMVRASIVAVVYTFDPAMPADNLKLTPVSDLKTHLDDQVNHFLRLIDKLDEDSWDGIAIAVAKALSKENSPKEHTAERTQIVEHVKDLFADYGIEVVDMLDKGIKDGERQGVERVREVLETHVALSGVSDDSEDAQDPKDDTLAGAIQNILGDSSGSPYFDTAEMDKILKESGFAFPLLDKKPSSSGEVNMDVGDLEKLSSKIKLARSKLLFQTFAVEG